MSRIGQGTGMRGGNRQSNHTRMGFQKLVDLFQHDYDHGVTFYDMADLYGSHVYLREALRSIPRDKVAILTKLWFRYDGEPATVAAGFKKQSAEMAIQRFRHELSTDYIDVVLMHCLMTPQWEAEMEPYMAALSEAKEKKQVRAVGVSCHDLGALKTAAQCPWVDVILARINPKGASMDGSVGRVRGGVAPRGALDSAGGAPRADRGRLSAGPAAHEDEPRRPVRGGGGDARVRPAV
jgi:aryl-alcohol dehydrogenase-like predicted oxidoreductase